MNQTSQAVGVAGLDQELEELRLLAFYTRQFSQLIDAGMSIQKSLVTIIEEVPPPFAAALQDISTNLAKGEYLWKCLKSHPRYFSEFYVSIYRLGEMSGLIDETCSDLSALVDEVWEYSDLLEGKEKLFFLGLGSEPKAADWGELSESGQRVCALLLCRSLSRLLSMGTPLPLGFEIAAALTPTKQCEELRRVAHSHSGDPLWKQLLGISGLPATMVRFIETGSANGSMQLTLDHGAQYYRQMLLANSAGDCTPSLIEHRSRRNAPVNPEAGQWLVELWEYTDLVRKIEVAELINANDFFNSQLSTLMNQMETYIAANSLTSQLAWLATRTNATLTRFRHVAPQDGPELQLAIDASGQSRIQRLKPLRQKPHDLRWAVDAAGQSRKADDPNQISHDIGLASVCVGIVMLAVRSNAALVCIEPVQTMDGVLTSVIMRVGTSSHEVKQLPASFLEPMSLFFRSMSGIGGSDGNSVSARTSEAGIRISWNQSADEGKISIFHFNFTREKLGPVIYMRLEGE